MRSRENVPFAFTGTRYPCARTEASNSIRWILFLAFLAVIGVMYGRRVVLTDAAGRVVADTRTDGPLLYGGP